MKVKELLDSESKWTQHYTARRTDSIACNALDPAASSWCLYGALQKCYTDLTEWVAAYDKLTLVIRKHYDSDDSPIHFNDTHCFSDVEAVLEEADV